MDGADEGLTSVPLVCPLRPSEATKREQPGALVHLRSRRCLAYANAGRPYRFPTSARPNRHMDLQWAPPEEYPDPLVPPAEVHPCQRPIYKVGGLTIAKPAGLPLWSENPPRAHLRVFRQADSGPGRTPESGLKQNQSQPR